MNLNMLVSLMGGIGFFMLGMRLMTDGLKYAAGDSLRNILKKSTSTRVMGICSGAFITTMAQSSSAVSVAVIGFVNAGLMEFGQAVSIIYGSNIGSTTTAWLVSLIGFRVKIKLFALPLIGLGMLVRLIDPESRKAALGDAAAGFGVIFVGIDILKSGFAGLGQNIDIASFAGGGFTALVIFVALGFLMTCLMQSSGASIAIILTAAAGHLIPINDAAAAIIGANVGTTSTAVLAVIGSGPDAKRLAGAHVIFNLITGAVALLILPMLIYFLDEFERFFGLENSPATLLSLFHTTFNVLGVMLLYPMTGHLVRFLKGRWHTVDEDEAVPHFLNKHVLNMPVMAVQSMAMELTRIGSIARHMAQGAISLQDGPTSRLRLDKNIVDKLILEVEKFSVRLQRTNLPTAVDRHLPNCLRVAGYYRAVAEISLDVANYKGREHVLPENQELRENVLNFLKDTVVLLGRSDQSLDDYDSAACQTYAFELKHTKYNDLKLKLLLAASRGEMKVRGAVHLMEILAKIRRLGEQAEKGARYLAEIRKFKDD